MINVLCQESSAEPGCRGESGERLDLDLVSGKGFSRICVLRICPLSGLVAVCMRDDGYVVCKPQPEYLSRPDAVEIVLDWIKMGIENVLLEDGDLVLI